MHDMFNLTRKPSKARETTPERHVPACNILHGHVSFQKLELQRKKTRFLVVRNGFTLVEKQFAKVHRDNGNGGTS